MSLAEKLIDNSMRDKAAARKFNNERRLVVLERVKDESTVMSQEAMPSVGTKPLAWVEDMNRLGGRHSPQGAEVWNTELANRLRSFYMAADIPEPGFGHAPIPRSVTNPNSP